MSKSDSKKRKTKKMPQLDITYSPETVKNVADFNLQDQEIIDPHEMLEIEYSLATAGQVKVKEQENSVPLLLAYTYFLNSNFSSETLKPTVTVTELGNGSIYLKATEWYTLFTYQKEIDTTYRGLLGNNVNVDLGTNVRLELDHIKHSMFLINNCTKIEIKCMEFCYMVQLTELFKGILHMYNLMQPHVQEYYIKYTKLCFEKNVMCLNQDNFFGAKSAVTWNFPRLFHELGLYFIQKVLNH